MHELAIIGTLKLPLYDNVTMCIDDIKKINYNMYDDIIASIEESLRNEFDWSTVTYNKYTLDEIMDMIPPKMSDFFSLNMCLAYYFLDKLETNKLKIMSVDLMCINSIYTYKAYLKVDIFDLVNNQIKPLAEE